MDAQTLSQPIIAAVRERRMDDTLHDQAAQEPLR
jgi:hypothetical protein